MAESWGEPLSITTAMNACMVELSRSSGERVVSCPELWLTAKKVVPSSEYINSALEPVSRSVAVRVSTENPTLADSGMVTEY